jgi:hypothetical protein
MPDVVVTWLVTGSPGGGALVAIRIGDRFMFPDLMHAMSGRFRRAG